MAKTVTLAFDSFKGSIGAQALGELLRAPLLDALPDTAVMNFPVSDGGDGFLEVLQYHLDCETVSCPATDPLQRPISAGYLWQREKKLAVVEAAAANGLVLLSEHERDPLAATTFGVGQLLLEVANRGAGEIIVGVGGSATIDGGIGMAEALGFRFLDESGRTVGLQPARFNRLHKVVVPESGPLEHVNVRVACDVSTPLAEAIGLYGPQKGGTPETLSRIEANLSHAAGVFDARFGCRFMEMERGGAAGGLAAGLNVFAGASLEPGMELFDSLTGLESRIAESSLVITGEGRLDEQSSEGKAVSYVERLCREHNVPVVGLCGSAGEHGIRFDDLFLLTDSGFAVGECISNPTAAVDRMLPKLIASVRRRLGLQGG